MHAYSGHARAVALRDRPQQRSQPLVRFLGGYPANSPRGSKATRILVIVPSSTRRQPDLLDHDVIRDRAEPRHRRPLG
jgi:hypothetical protein